MHKPMQTASLWRCLNYSIRSPSYSCLCIFSSATSLIDHLLTQPALLFKTYFACDVTHLRYIDYSNCGHRDADCNLTNLEIIPKSKLNSQIINGPLNLSQVCFYSISSMCSVTGISKLYISP